MISPRGRSTSLHLTAAAPLLRKPPKARNSTSSSLASPGPEGARRISCTSIVRKVVFASSPTCTTSRRERSSDSRSASFSFATVMVLVFRLRQMSLPPTRIRARNTGSTAGRVAEWFKAPDSKSDVVARLPGVQIPPLPPNSSNPAAARVPQPADRRSGRPPVLGIREMGIRPRLGCTVSPRPAPRLRSPSSASVHPVPRGEPGACHRGIVRASLPHTQRLIRL